MRLPRYPEYRDSGVEWLGEVPSQWRVAPLKRNFRLIADRATKKRRAVALENIEGWSGRYIETEGEFQGDGIAFEPDDILFGKLRPYLAKVLLADFPGEAVGDFHVLRPSEKLIPRFAQYQMLQCEFIGVVDGSTFGSKMPRASWEALGGMPFVVPAVSEQVQIASFLDHETARIDALIAEQEKLLALLAEKRQAAISHAVTRGLDPNVPMKDSGIPWLGQVPAHWKVLRLGALFREVNEPGREDLPLLSVSIHDGVSDREFGEEELDRKVARSDDKSKYKAAAAGDLTYNMMRAWQGGLGSVTVDGMVSPAYVVARPKADFLTTHIERLLRTPSAVAEMKRYSRGITDFRLRLYWEEFKVIRLALPPKHEQVEIAEFIERVTGRIEVLQINAVRNISLLKERRSALITAAVTGQVDVRGLSGASED